MNAEMVQETQRLIQEHCADQLNEFLDFDEDVEWLFAEVTGIAATGVEDACLLLCVSTKWREFVFRVPTTAVLPLLFNNVLNARRCS